MYWVRIALLLLLASPAWGQGNPGFLQGAVLCANSGCSTTPPVNPLGLNQAFIGKADNPIIGTNTVPINMFGSQFAVQNSAVTQQAIYNPVTAAMVQVFDNIQSVGWLPVGSTIGSLNAFGAYIRNEAVSSGGGGVGYYALLTCGANGADCWGENYRLVDCENISSCSGIQNAVLIAGEDDFYVGNTCAAGVTGPCISGGNGPTTVGARSVILSSFMDQQPNFAFGWSCSNVSTISGNNPPFWNVCFSSNNGAAATALSIGTLKHVPPCPGGVNPPCPPVPIVPNSASQSAAFSYTDGTGAFQNWQMFVDVAGTFQLQSTQPNAAFNVSGLEADTSLLVGPSGMPLFEVGLMGTSNVTFPNLTGAAGYACLDINGVISKSSSCGGGGGIVNSVSNADSTLTFSPTTGAVVGSLNLAHANTWTALQTFSAGVSATNINSATGLIIGVGAPNQVQFQVGGTPQVGIQSGFLFPEVDNGAALGSPTFRWSALYVVGLSTLGPVTLAPGASALTVTATQPASPTTPQSAILYNITSAGSAAQNNFGWSFNYLAGYTGASNTNALNVFNSAASTGHTLISAGSNSVSGNIGTGANAAGTTTGLNVGTRTVASNGNTNVGDLGVANVAGGAGTSNFGTVGSAFNNSGGFMIGGFFSLAQTIQPAFSAALLADNGTQTAPIALFQNNGATVASVTQTGGLTGTLPTSAGAGGLFVCVDTSGVMYKKATCP